jgi:hypothetical protein
MKKGITFVGMDAHKVAVKQAALLPEQTKPVEWQLANEQAAVRRMVRKVQRMAPGEVRFCYEAGPCGYVAQGSEVLAENMSIQEQERRKSLVLGRGAHLPPHGWGHGDTEVSKRLASILSP